MSLLERIYYFHDRILGNRYPNSGDLVREFEVSSATAHRDITYLRDRLLAPLAFSQKQNGYYYTEEGFKLPFEDTPNLVLMLAMLQKMGEETGLAGLPELQKLRRRLKQLVQIGNRDTGDLVHCEWIETEPIEPQVFAAVLRGLLNGVQVRISYRATKGNVSERAIEPLKLVNYQGRWYILAWCCLRKDRRMFHLARITAAETTGQKVDHSLGPEDDWLSGSFGIFKGNISDRFTAEILFTGTAADIVRHQRWHPEQKMEKTPDGIRLTLPVADDRELLMKVLQFGSQAMVLSPVGLQEKISRELTQAMNLYKPPQQKKH